MRKVLFIVTMLAVAACSGDNDLDIAVQAQAPANAGEAITFTLVRGDFTRLHYARQDWLQLEWDEGDLVTIACDQTQAPTGTGASRWQKKTSAVYRIAEAVEETYDVQAEDEDGVTGTYTLSAKTKARMAPLSSDRKETLYWGPDTEEGTPRQHTFYAAYGDSVTIEPGLALAKFVYQPDQILTQDAKGAWANTKQAFMVATATTTPVEGLDLPFHPIMTTIEVVVRGTGDGGEAIRVKSLEVIIPKAQDMIYTSDTTAYFNYDFATSAGVLEAAGTRKDERIVFKLQTPQTVAPDGSVTITAILPPIAIDEQNPVSIVVNTSDGVNTAVLRQAVAPGSKVVIKTPNWEADRPELDYVDLGLSVKWAKWNLGATAPEEYGDYYGFGCTEPYGSSSNMDWATYWKKLGCRASVEADCVTELDPLLPFLLLPGEEYSGKNIAGTEWDVAHVVLGGTWRLPSIRQVRELENTKNCTWEWTTENRVWGYKVTSKKPGYEGNHIFLPAAGRHWFTTQKLYSGGNGYYWTSEPRTNNANVMFFYQDFDSLGVRQYYIDCGCFTRRNGFSVRAVCD
ncbi:MAG: hypothetical protein HUK01_02590 [Bacteroidaceae bacterium]|nr:hypothetical protein [Bacteroidaceae bacterium]